MSHPQVTDHVLRAVMSSENKPGSAMRIEGQAQAKLEAAPIDPLLRPIQIGKLTLRNRIMSTSHETELDDHGYPLEAYQRYHEEKAKGGLALTMFGGSGRVSADASWGGSQLDYTSDAIIPVFQQFAERIHSHGAAIMCQISHAGRRADSSVGDWLPAIGPSHTREAYRRNFASEMDRKDIDRVIRDFGQAARRAQEGGLDGLETMTGGHLIGQFLSPMVNRRTDEFGGSLENRMRFLRKVYDEIRNQVGSDFPIGIRYTIDEDHPDGLGFAEAVQVANMLEREGLVDFFNCIFGRFDTKFNLLVYNIPDMTSPASPWLQKVGAFRAETSLPIFHAGKISDIATARYAVSNGLLDMVGMTRAHMADPQIVNKLKARQEDQIRPCVGASHCLYRPVRCIHNAATGRETWLPQVIVPSVSPSRKAVVIGGGPAGLEAARVLSERGHHVVLFEATDRLGGQLALAARAHLRRDLKGIVEWREAELVRLGVEVRLNSYVDAERVLAEAPNVVIVATGGYPDLGTFEGEDLCLSMWDLLGNPAAVAEDILIFDGTGRHPAPSTAAHLASAGKMVTFVALDPAIAPEMETHSQITYRKAFAELRIRTLTEYEIVRVSANGGRRDVLLRHLLTGQDLSITCSQVAIENGTYPVTEVFDDLRSLSSNDGKTDLASLIGTAPPRLPSDKRFELHRIGDAVSSRSVHAGILDALRLCVQF
jgi:2,4-dienoyl-CoA reductase-like NADH-dependent reductase (Old Yellow Enzyme family)/thioredoxin reductase